MNKNIFRFAIFGAATLAQDAATEEEEKVEVIT